MTSPVHATRADSRWLAIVPMKRHSERVPGKNIRPLNGRPLYFWVLQALRAVEQIAGIVIDTDAEEIADMVTRDFDVQISMRPERLRGDCVSTNELLAHVITQCPGYDHFLQTHVTNPLLTPKTITNAIRALTMHPEKDSLFTVTRVQTRLYDGSGKPINHDPAVLIRTQDLTPVYEENSNLYLFSRESFNRGRSRIGAAPLLFETDKLEGLDIDDESDFLLAEVLMAMRVRPVTTALSV
jgi:N-acylneuraminate cytidylyltransferase